MGRASANWLVRFRDSTGTWHAFTLAGGPAFADQNEKQLYRRFLERPPSIAVAMPKPFPGLRGGVATGNYGVIRLSNKKDRGGVRPLDYLKALSFRRQPWEAYLANGWPRPPADLTDPEWGDSVGSGVIDRLSSGVDTISFSLRDGFPELNRRLAIPRFRGYGSSVARFDTTGTVDFGNLFVPTGSFFREVAVRFGPGDLAAVNQDLLKQKDGAGTKGYRLRANTGAGDRNLRFHLFELGINLTTADDVLSEDGLWHTVSFGWDKGNERAVLCLDGALLVENTAATGTMTSHAESMIAGTGCTCQMTELRAWTGFRSSTEVASDWDAAELDSDTGGLGEYWRQGNGTTWQAALNTPANDGTASGAVTFVYGDEGQEEHAGKTKPHTFGPAKGLEGTMGYPGARTIHLHSSAVLSVDGAYQEADALDEGPASPAHFTADTAGGTYTVHTLPFGDEGTLRAHATAGNPAPTYEELIQHYALDSGVGPLPAARAATPFVRGPDFFGTVAHHLPTTDRRPKAPEVLADILRGADAVLTWNPARELEVVRVPPEPFSPFDPGVVTLKERVHFDTEGVTVEEVLDAQRRQKVWWDINHGSAMDRGDINANAEKQDRGFFERDHRAKQHRADEAWTAAHPEADPGEDVPAHYVEGQPARQHAQRRQLGVLGQEGLRRIRIRLTQKVAGAYRLGAQLWVISAELDASAGRPFFVTSVSFQTAKFGTVEALELPYVRSPPATILTNTFGTGGLADISDDVLNPGSTGLEMTYTLGNIRVAIPPALPWNQASKYYIRFRFAGAVRDAIAFFESGAYISPLSASEILLRGVPLTNPDTYPAAPGDEAVYAIELDPQDLADKTGAELEFLLTLLRDSITTDHVLMAIDLVYKPQ